MEMKSIDTITDREIETVIAEHCEIYNISRMMLGARLTSLMEVYQAKILLNTVFAVNNGADYSTRVKQIQRILEVI